MSIRLYVLHVCAKDLRKIYQTGFSHYPYVYDYEQYSFFILSSFPYFLHRTCISLTMRKKKNCTWKGQEGVEIGSCLRAAASDFRFPSARWRPAWAGRHLDAPRLRLTAFPREWTALCASLEGSVPSPLSALALPISALAHVHPSAHWLSWNP